MHRCPFCEVESENRACPTCLAKGHLVASSGASLARDDRTAVAGYGAPPLPPTLFVVELQALGPTPTLVVKIVRESLELSLSDAFAQSKLLPLRVGHDLALDEALVLKARLHQAGANATHDRSERTTAAAVEDSLR